MYVLHLNGEGCLSRVFLGLLTSQVLTLLSYDDFVFYVHSGDGS